MLFDDFQRFKTVHRYRFETSSPDGNIAQTTSLIEIFLIKLIVVFIILCFNRVMSDAFYGSSLLDNVQSKVFPNDRKKVIMIVIVMKKIIKLIDSLLLKFIVLVLICKNCRIQFQKYDLKLIRSFKNF